MEGVQSGTSYIPSMVKLVREIRRACVVYEQPCVADK